MKTVKEIIVEQSLFAKKSLGQNFLTDQNITDKIVRHMDVYSANVIEIGPGPGLLTRSILKQKPKKLTLIEKDTRFESVIKDLIPFFPETEINFINMDALEFDFSVIPEDTKVLANLPYNVASQILVNLIGNSKNIDSMCLMFQKEVAKRITAKPGNSDFSRLSVLTSIFYNAKILFDLSPKLFTPPPKIVSSVVKFDRLDNIPSLDIKKLEKIIFKLFNNKRKQLRKALEEMVPDFMSNFDVYTQDQIKSMATKRPSELSIEEILYIYTR